VPTNEWSGQALLFFSARGIVSSPHEFQVVGAVVDGPANSIGIVHIGHFEGALLLPLVLNSMAVGECQHTELPVPHDDRVPPSVSLALQIPRPPVPSAHVGFFFEEYVLDAGILDLRELLVGRVSPLLCQPTVGAGADIAVHSAWNAIAAMCHFGSVSPVGRAVIEIDIQHVREQGPAFATPFLVLKSGRGARNYGAVLFLRQFDPVIAPAGRGGVPIMPPDQPVIVVLGVQDPGQDQLMLIGQTHAARRLFPHPAQGRYQDTHQQGNDCDDHQQLYECKSVSSFHNGSPIQILVRKSLPSAKEPIQITRSITAGCKARCLRCRPKTFSTWRKPRLRAYLACRLGLELFARPHNDPVIRIGSI